MVLYTYVCSSFAELEATRAATSSDAAHALDPSLVVCKPLEDPQQRIPAHHQTNKEMDSLLNKNI
jgi:hypothetical protein